MRQKSRLKQSISMSQRVIMSLAVLVLALTMLQVVLLIFAQICHGQMALQFSVMEKKILTIAKDGRIQFQFLYQMINYKLNYTVILGQILFVSAE